MVLNGSRPGPSILFGTAAMSIAGIAWVAYTCPDRDAKDSLATTANRHVVAAMLAIAVALGIAESFALTLLGVALAATSGAITSGLGCAGWNRVDPQLGLDRAWFAQLAAPTLTVLGAVTILGEPLLLPEAVAAAVVLGGAALASAARHGRAG